MQAPRQKVPPQEISAEKWGGTLLEIPLRFIAPAEGGPPLKHLWPVVAALLTLAMQISEVFSSAELLLRDALLRTLPSRSATRVAVVLIDEEALRTYGPWPWGREQLAALVGHAFTAGAKGVALDFLLPEERPGDEALNKAINEGPSALAAGLDEAGHWLLPNRRLTPHRVGHVSFDLDQDGVVRRFSSTKQMGERSLPALPIAAAQLADPALPVPVGIMLRPAFRTRVVPLLGAASVLGGKAGSTLHGRVAFLGSSAAGVGDRFMSPISRGGSPDPGVLVEAVSTEAILSGDLLRVASPLFNALLTLGLAGIGLMLLSSGRRTLPLLTPLLALSPIPIAAVSLSYLDLETAPVAIATALLLVGGVIGVSRSRRSRTAMDHARARISELEALQKVIAKARQQDAEAQRVVAHELKTPLTSVKGLAQLLAQFDLSNAERNRVAQMVVTETARLAQMVDALLDLERLRLREHDKDAKPLDFSALCADRADYLQAGTQRTISLDIVPRLSILGDKALLDRMVENLVSNAFKFSPDGTPVRITLRQSTSHAVLEIEDQGPGVPMEERTQIFGRFARGSAQGAAPGLGLGLALVAEVVSWHRGSVEADEGPKGGSLFRVRLPLTSSGSTD